MMTTDQRAELDAVMARATIARDDCQYYSMSQPFERTREAENMLNLAMRMTPLLTAHIDAQAAEIARLREALAKSEDAMREMFRYYDGGETRGSYDGKPERAQLRTAWQIARAALASTGAA